MTIVLFYIITTGVGFIYVNSSSLGQNSIKHAGVAGSEAVKLVTGLEAALNLGDRFTKGRGFSTDSVSLLEYEQMYLYSLSIKANKTYGKTNYSLGSVWIDNKEIIID